MAPGFPDNWVPPGVVVRRTADGTVLWEERRSAPMHWQVVNGRSEYRGHPGRGGRLTRELLEEWCRGIDERYGS